MPNGTASVSNFLQVSVSPLCAPWRVHSVLFGSPWQTNPQVLGKSHSSLYRCFCWVTCCQRLNDYVNHVILLNWQWLGEVLPAMLSSINPSSSQDASCSGDATNTSAWWQLLRVGVTFQGSISFTWEGEAKHVHMLILGRGQATANSAKTQWHISSMRVSSSSSAHGHGLVAIFLLSNITNSHATCAGSREQTSQICI